MYISPLHLQAEHVVWGLATHVFVFTDLLWGACSFSIQCAARGFVFGLSVFCLPPALFYLWAFPLQFVCLVVMGVSVPCTDAQEPITGC